MQLPVLEAEQNAFAALAASADPALLIAACPGWTASALVAHVAGVHRWAAATAGLDVGAPIPDDDPFDRAATSADYPAAAAHLRAALAEPQRPCPTLCGPGTVAWWVRRQVHETLIHRFDLAAALDVAVAVDPAVAADCVGEVIDTMQPRQVRLRRMSAPLVGVVLNAPGRTWQLGAAPVAQISGPEIALALLLWRRTTLDDPRIEVTGDREAAAGLMAQALTP